MRQLIITYLTHTNTLTLIHLQTLPISLSLSTHLLKGFRLYKNELTQTQLGGEWNTRQYFIWRRKNAFYGKMEKQNWSVGVKIREKSQKSEDEDEEKTVSSFIAGYYTINICFHYRRKQIIWYSLFTLYRTYMFVQLPMQL